MVYTCSRIESMMEAFSTDNCETSLEKNFPEPTDDVLNLALSELNVVEMPHFEVQEDLMLSSVISMLSINDRGQIFDDRLDEYHGDFIPVIPIIKLNDQLLESEAVFQPEVADDKIHLKDDALLNSNLVNQNTEKEIETDFTGVDQWHEEWRKKHFKGSTLGERKKSSWRSVSMERYYDSGYGNSVESEESFVSVISCTEDTKLPGSTPSVSATSSISSRCTNIDSDSSTHLLQVDNEPGRHLKIIVHESENNKEKDAPIQPVSPRRHLSCSAVEYFEHPDCLQHKEFDKIAERLHHLSATNLLSVKGANSSSLGGVHKPSTRNVQGSCHVHAHMNENGDESLPDTAQRKTECLSNELDFENDEVFLWDSETSSFPLVPIPVDSAACSSAYSNISPSLPALLESDSPDFLFSEQHSPSHKCASPTEEEESSNEFKCTSSTECCEPNLASTDTANEHFRVVKSFNRFEMHSQFFGEELEQLSRKSTLPLTSNSCDLQNHLFTGGDSSQADDEYSPSLADSSITDLDSPSVLCPQDLYDYYDLVLKEYSILSNDDTANNPTDASSGGAKGKRRKEPKTQPNLSPLQLLHQAMKLELKCKIKLQRLDSGKEELYISDKEEKSTISYEDISKREEVRRRNRIHAKKSRARKRKLFECLMKENEQLITENRHLASRRRDVEAKLVKLKHYLCGHLQGDSCRTGPEVPVVPKRHRANLASIPLFLQTRAVSGDEKM